MEVAEQVVLSRFLNRSMKVWLSDGRRVEGVFQCTDSAPNLILANSLEFWEEAATEEGRYVGLIMIPAPHIRRISVPSSAMPPS